MQTKTLSNLVLEFPALEKSKGKALKGGSGNYPISWKDHYYGLGYTSYGGSWWDGGGNYLGAPIVVNGHSWHNDPYDVRNGNSGGAWDITQTGGGGGGGGGGNGDGLPYQDQRDMVSLAIDHANSWVDFSIVGQRAFDGNLKTDLRSVINEIVERPNFKELFSSLQGEGVFKGLAVLDKVGKVLGVVGALESGLNLYNDIKDGHLDNPVLLADAAVNFGSLFLRSNIVGFAVSGGWMLIKGELDKGDWQGDTERN
jgi:hypothetical protein